MRCNDPHQFTLKESLIVRGLLPETAIEATEQEVHFDVITSIDGMASCTRYLYVPAKLNGSVWNVKSNKIQLHLTMQALFALATGLVQLALRVDRNAKSKFFPL